MTKPLTDKDDPEITGQYSMVGAEPWKPSVRSESAGIVQVLPLAPQPPTETTATDGPAVFVPSAGTGRGTRDVLINDLIATKQPKESETPRTDATKNRLMVKYGGDLVVNTVLDKFAEEARQLERELAAAHACHADLSLSYAKVQDQLARSANTGAIAEIAAERQRQVEKEGWSHEHDDGHSTGCLAVAGACYALYGISTISGEHETWRRRYARDAQELWPWDAEWWKPKNPRRDLIRAAALIVAEIEKIDRQAIAPDRSTNLNSTKET